MLNLFLGFITHLFSFPSVMGEVSSGDINKSLMLMGLGMLGIFIVMLLIYLVIVILNKVTGKSDKDSEED